MAALLLAVHCWLRVMPNRADQPPRRADVRFVAAQFDPAGFAPLRLAGAWRVEVDDPRFGGVSALAIHGDSLLALTDSGTVIRLPRPGSGRIAAVRDLPAGPGTSAFKRDRDGEAIARDPSGRGWWVAFEQWHQLWLYDASFTRALGRIDLGRDRWRSNKGVEAMIAEGGRLVLFPEPGDEWLAVGNDKFAGGPLADRFGSVSDAVRLNDGRIFLITREVTLAGLEKRLVVVGSRNGKPALVSVARLALGATDNVEAIAAEPLARGGTRLWLMTDNDFRPRKATLLVALDLP